MLHFQTAFQTARWLPHITSYTAATARRGAMSTWDSSEQPRHLIVHFDMREKKRGWKQKTRFQKTRTLFVMNSTLEGLLNLGPNSSRATHTQAAVLEGRDWICYFPRNNICFLMLLISCILTQILKKIHSTSKKLHQVHHWFFPVSKLKLKVAMGKEISWWYSCVSGHVWNKLTFLKL